MAVTVQQFKISSGVCSRFRPHGAFAAILENGSVVTLGSCRLWREQLGSSRSAQVWVCAADSGHMGRLLQFLKMDLSLPWGHADFGGNSSAVQDRLRCGCVRQIQATDGAFAAILQDGSVVTWGHADFGGDSSAVQDRLRCGCVRQIQATDGAFAAILEDGFVVTWGHERSGGDSSAVRALLQGVMQIQATRQDSSHTSGIRCDSGRWIRRDLGSCNQWREQFGSSRSAQVCGANSSHRSCVCCNS